jgi:hypothetical protein
MRIARIVIVLSVAVVAGASWALRLERRESAALALMQRTELARQLELRRAGDAAAGRLAAVTRRRRELQAAVPAPRVGAAEAVGPKMAAAMAAFAKMPFREIALEKNPDLQARYLRSRRAEWTAKYGALWQKLQLNPAQIDRFVANLTEAAARELDLSGAQRAQGLEDSDGAVTRLRREAANRAEAAQRELLGDAGFQQLQQYEMALPMRDVVDGLATTLVFLDAPLSAAQAEKLTRVLVEANVGYRRNGRPEPLFPQDVLSQKPARETVDSVHVLEELRLFLTPEQLAPLELNLVRMRQVYQVVNLLHESSPGPVIGFTWGWGP